MTEFTNKNVVITGAAGAIGSELVALLANAGAHLVLHDQSDAVLAAVKHRAQASGRRVLTVTGDIRDPSVHDEIRASVKQLGGIDGFAPAAAVYRAHPLATMTLEQWRDTISINLDAVFALTSTLLPEFRDGASAVFFGSIAGQRGSREHAHYAATKGAMISFARSLALEYGQRGIRANTVAPGIIASPMTNSLVASSAGTLEESTPLRRLGLPCEVAEAVFFLLSSRSSFITGVQLDVNGGLHMSG